MWNCIVMIILDPLTFVIFWERQKALENCENNIEKEALPIWLLHKIIHKHCLTIAVAVLVQENVKVNICDDSWPENSCMPYFEGDKRL